MRSGAFPKAARVWSNRRGPIPLVLGRALEPIYRAALARRNRAFDAGRGVVELGVPVISVGNISVGGVGKTPMVMRVVEWLQAEGRRPAIAMRGYKAKAGAPSDEEAEYRARFADIPVVAQPDRVAGLSPLIERAEIDCVVLDDGFQHRRIQRALDVVLLDATRDPFQDRCLPAGWLREPAESLLRADAIVLTHTERRTETQLDSLRERVRAVTGLAPMAEARHEWSRLNSPRGSMPLAGLQGRLVVIACAIGNPNAFVEGARAAGADVRASICKRDHYEWRERDAIELSRRARECGAGGSPALVLTTGKDWVKLQRLSAACLPNGIVVPHLEMRFDRGESDLRAAVLAAASTG